MHRSAYYAWTKRAAQGPSDHDRQEARLVAEIRRLHARSGGTYGVPRITVALRRGGFKVNHKRVERLSAPTASRATGPAGGAA